MLTHKTKGLISRIYKEFINTQKEKKDKNANLKNKQKHL